MIGRLKELFISKSSREETTKALKSLESIIKSKNGEMGNSKKPIEWIPDNIALEMFYKDASKEAMTGPAAAGAAMAAASAAIAAAAVQAATQVVAAQQAAHQRGNSILSTKALDMEESDRSKLDVKQLISIRKNYLK